MREAHYKLVDFTPSGPMSKRRAADDFDIPSSASQKATKPKRSRTTDFPSSSSHGTLRTPSGHAATSRIPSEKIQWSTTENRETTTPQRRDPVTQASIDAVSNGISEGAVTQDGPSNEMPPPAPLMLQDEFSPHDTVMNTSSDTRLRATATSLNDSLAVDFEQHNPHELFPNSTYMTASNSTASIFVDAMDAIEQQAADAVVLPEVQSLADQAIDNLQGSASESMGQQTDPTPVQQVTAVVINESSRNDEIFANASEQAPSVDPFVVPELPKSRSSRSRSQLTEATVTPKRATTGRPKRRKTTGFTFTSPKSQLVEMGFNSSLAEWALMETNNDVDDAVALLAGGPASQKRVPKVTRKSLMKAIIEDDDEDEIPAPAKVASEEVGKQPKRGRGRPKKSDVQEDKTNEADEQDDEDEDELGQEAPLKQVQLPREIGRGRPKKAATRVDADAETDQPEDDDEDELTHEPQPKKARGRPKRSQQPELQPRPENDADGQPETATESDVLAEPNDTRVPRETTPSTPSSIVVVRKPCTSHGDATATDLPDTTVAQESGRAPPTTSPVKRHSPLNLSRVPFKVGLSRRMRVEPLLRVVKKK